MSDPIVAEQMAPENSPGEVPRYSGVRRVNNLPVYIVGAVMAGFLLIMLLVAMDRADKGQATTVGVKQKGGNSSMFAKELLGDRKDGLTPPATPPVMPRLPDSAATAADADALPRPPQSTLQASQRGLQVPADPETERIRMSKMQMFEQGVRARTGVTVDAPRSLVSLKTAPGTDDLLSRMQAARLEAGSVTSDDPTTAYKARLAQIEASGLAATGTAGTRASLEAPHADGSGNNLAAFDKRVAADRWQLGTPVEAPRTPYQLRAGFVIPAIMISGINSDLPGQIVAQVSQDVRDTATGRHLLLPQGSRLVGAYSSEVAYGQSRIFIAWQRIVYPDGKALDLGAMPGSDSAGYAGFSDQANNHYVRLFASAFLMSGVTAGISLSQDRSSTSLSGTQQTTGGALSEALGQQLGQVTAQLIAKNLNIAPTLEIRPGYRFNVMVIKDLTFYKPYEAFDY